MPKKIPAFGEVEGDQELLTVAEISVMLRVSKMTVYRLREAGELPGSLVIGRSIRIPRGVVRIYLAKNSS